jgi:hypothetical protein
VGVNYIFILCGYIYYVEESMSFYILSFLYVFIFILDGVGGGMVSLLSTMLFFVGRWW